MFPTSKSLDPDRFDKPLVDFERAQFELAKKMFSCSDDEYFAICHDLVSSVSPAITSDMRAMAYFMMSFSSPDRSDYLDKCLQWLKVFDEIYQNTVQPDSEHALFSRNLKSAVDQLETVRMNCTKK